MSLNSKTELKVWPMGTKILPEKQKNILSLIKANETQVHYETSENSIISYRMIPDIDGIPKIVLASTTPRNAFLFIKRIYKESYGVLLAANFILILMLLKIMNETIIGPINNISKQLTSIENNIESSQQISGHSSDEIGQLAKKANRVFIKFSRSRHEAMAKAYQSGTQAMRTEMLNDIGHLTKPAIASVDAIEKAITQLPMNTLEKVTAEFINHTDLQPKQRKLATQLQALNQALRENLKQIRIEAREAHTRVLRISTTIRTHAISLHKPKSITAIRSPKATNTKL